MLIWISGYICWQMLIQGKETFQVDWKEKSENNTGEKLQRSFSFPWTGALDFCVVFFPIRITQQTDLSQTPI